ncbi:MAG: hypothetical protein IIY11_02340 [Clostridia bacterium]|nr:hypothetical protein [Clostridia bacterium]MBQ2326208.1 hypothetical protein [Clostridia bacterium]
MTDDRMNIVKAIRNLSWSIWFLVFRVNINMMGLPLLPRFIGWIFAARSCSLMGENDSKSGFYKNLCLFTAAYEFLETIGLSFSLGLISRFIGIAKIWLFYSVLSMVIYPVIHKEEGRMLSFWRSAYLIVYTAAYIMLLAGESAEILMVIAVCLLIVALGMFFTLRRAANLLAAEEDFRPETLAHAPSE